MSAGASGASGPASARRRIRDAVEAVEFAPDGGLAWRGRAIRAAPDGVVGALARRLHATLHRRGTVAPPPSSGPPPSTPAERRAFAAELTALAADRWRWDEGWTVRDDEGETRVVEKDGLALWVPREACRGADGETLRPGDPVRVRVPALRLGVSPGFALLHGARIPCGRRTRIYLHVGPGGARELVSATGRWNEAGLPFGLKVVADPAGFARRDTAVAFVPREAHERAARVLVETGVTRWTRDGVPAFALEVAPGVGVADDPEGESVGERRCRQLAEGIARARGAASLEERMRIVEARFAEDGISLDAPWLEPGGAPYDPAPWRAPTA